MSDSFPDWECRPPGLLISGGSEAVHVITEQPWGRLKKMTVEEKRRQNARVKKRRAEEDARHTPHRGTDLRGR